MFDEYSSLHGLAGLSNDELLTNTQRLVGCGNQLLAALLAHLGEVEARGVHRERSCASLYTYCVYVLRIPEDSALRRAKAARIVREFPATLAAIARGELHLTGLLLLGPHLTEANLVEVLALAKHRSKKEIEKLVRRLDPLPDVPPRIEPLGPPRAGFVTNFAPTWNAMAQALAGPVRDLPAGERPSDWIVDPSEWVSGAKGGARGTTSSMGDEADETPMPHVAERYKVQFTVNQDVDACGQRCRETRWLEFHHLDAHARGGLPTEENLTLRCRLCRTRHKRHYAAFGFMPHTCLPAGTASQEGVSYAA